MQALNEKFMSDEESDTENSGVLIKRSLSWRSDNLNKLMEKLDSRYIKQRTHSKPLKPRSIGPLSQRQQPSKAPGWATKQSTSTDPDNTQTNDLDNNPDHDDSPSDAECVR